jgi:hypothetical protein
MFCGAEVYFSDAKFYGGPVDVSNVLGGRLPTPTFFGSPSPPGVLLPQNSQSGFAGSPDTTASNNAPEMR